MTEELARTIEWEPAYDRRQKDADGNRTGHGGGAHCVTCRFVLSGPAGVVELVVYTGWWLKAMHRELENETMCFSLKPMPADLIAHSRAPWRATDGPRPECHRLKGNCYTQSWGPLRADRIFDRFVEKGEAAVWAELEGLYVEMKGLQPT